MSKQINRIPSLDYAKFFASLLVIAIHTTRSFGVDSKLGFFIINVICRLAVPFFVVCTGYFIGKRTHSINNQKTVYSIIKKQECTIIKLYLFWSFVYLLYSIPTWIKIGWFSMGAFEDYAISTVFYSSHYHLWYLLSLIYALPLFGICIKYMSVKSMGFAIPFLWLVKITSYGYYQWMPNPVKNLYDKLSHISGIWDAVFCILPLLLIGFVISIEKNRSGKIYVIGFIVSFVCLNVEAFFLRSMEQTAVSYIIFTLPVAYFLFHCISQMKFVKLEKYSLGFGMISTTIYCLHPMIGEVTDSLIKNTGIHYLMTTISAILISILYSIIKQKFIIKRR